MALNDGKDKDAERNQPDFLDHSVSLLDVDKACHLGDSLSTT